MGVASMVLGIISALVAFVPMCGIVAFLPAIIGLILGIIDVVSKSKKKEPKGQGLAGIILNSVAMVIIIVWLFMFAASVQDGSSDFQNAFKKSFDESIQKSIEQSSPSGTINP